MPVERHLGKIQGDGAGIGGIGKRKGTVGFLFLIVFVLNNIHKYLIFPYIF